MGYVRHPCALIKCTFLGSLTPLEFEFRRKDGGLGTSRPTLNLISSTTTFFRRSSLSTDAWQTDVPSVRYRRPIVDADPLRTMEGDSGSEKHVEARDAADEFLV